jgi:hypothetical protein
MSLFSLSWTTIASWVLPILIVLVRHISSTKPSTKPKGPTWRVVTKPANQWVYEDSGGWGCFAKINMNEDVHVRIVGLGSDILIASVRLTDADYEKKLTDAIRVAEDRVITLNAMDMGVAA